MTNWRSVAEEIAAMQAQHDAPPSLTMTLYRWVAVWLREWAKPLPGGGYWKNLIPDDLLAMADYLENGPTDRIPDEASALEVLSRIDEMTSRPPFDPDHEGRA